MSSMNETDLSNSTNDSENEEIPSTKIDVDPEYEKNLPSTDVIPTKTWGGIKFETSDHEKIVIQQTGIYGATGAGKTSLIKTLFADQKIPVVDMYIIVADPKGKSELVTAICANLYLNGKDYKKANIKHFDISEISKAIGLCLSPELSKTRKIIIFNDCLLVKKSRSEVISFVSKAKNFYTLCLIEIHDFAGDDMKNLRAACGVKIFINYSPRNIAQDLNKSVHDPIIIKYVGLSSLEQILIDVKHEGYFNKNYTTF